MSSETSSDINNIVNNKKYNGNSIIKKETTETDLYLGLVANPSKTLDETEESSSSLHFNNDEDHNTSANSTVSQKKHSMSQTKSSDSESSKPRFENVKINNTEKKKKHRERDRDREYKTETQNTYSTKTESKPSLTPQQERMKKIDLLRKLSDIKSKGYKLTKEYDFNSSVEEMEYEYDLLKSFVDRRNGIKLYKNTILNVSNIIEFFNSKYDPFGIKLDGWSEHMNIEVDSYDGVMEELYEKYKGRGKSMPPELKLLMLVLASASAFHFSKAFLSKMPGMDGIMNAQPEIISKIVNGKQQSKFMSEQELSIEKQKKELMEKEKELKRQMRSNNTQQQQPQPMNVMSQMMNMFGAQPVQSPPPQQQPPPQQVNTFQNYHQPVQFNKTNDTPFGIPSQLNQSNDPRDKPTAVIKKPESVTDILNRLHSRDTADTQDTQDETNNDRLISDTMSDGSTVSKTKGKKKKPMMSVM
jgi:hypothetical protein